MELDEVTADFEVLICSSDGIRIDFVDSLKISTFVCHTVPSPIEFLAECLTGQTLDDVFNRSREQKEKAVVSVGCLRI